MILFNNLRNKCSTFRFFSTIQSHTVDIKGQIVNYLKVGNGDNAVLCFPGALGTIWSDFRPQIESESGLCQQQFSVVAWDPPGYGASRPPNRKFDLKFYETDADYAHDLMQNLGFQRFSLLGWSDGGISSMILASKYQKSVEKLVIWGVNAFVLDDDIKSYEKIRDISDWSAKAKAPLIELYTEKGLQDMWNDWCDVMKEMQRNGGDICKKALKNIQCPTLILHGDKDPMVGLEHPKYLLKHIKNAKLHRFPDGKHNIHLRYAKEFNQITAEFLLNNA